MKKLWFLLVLACPALLYTQPKIEILQGTKFDFGTIYRGQKVERTLVVKNNGDKQLDIARVDVSCGCTGTTMTNEHIPPGESAELLIKFNSSNFQGQIHKTVSIVSNDQNVPTTMVEFTGNVIQEITVSPAQFWFKDAEVGKANYATVTLSNKSTEQVDLTGYDTHLPGLSLKLPADPIPPGQSVDLVAEYQPKEEKPVLNDGVSVKTSSKHEPDVFIRIFGNVKKFEFK